MYAHVEFSSFVVGSRSIEKCVRYKTVTVKWHKNVKRAYLFTATADPEQITDSFELKYHYKSNVIF